MFKTKFILPLLIFGAIFFVAGQLHALQNNILFKGELINENDGKPIGAEVTFIDEDGDKIKVNANELSGNFEQLLKADHNYKIIFAGADILRKEIEIKTDEAETYGEQSESFTVVKMESGAKIVEINVSNDNASLSNAGISALGELKTLLRFNRSLYLDLVTENESIKASLEELLNSKTWRMYKKKITIHCKDTYNKKNVNLAENMDLAIIIDKIEDPFK